MGALDRSKQGRNGLSMPHTPSPKCLGSFLTILGPKIGHFGGPVVLEAWRHAPASPPPRLLARPGTGVLCLRLGHSQGWKER